MTLFSKLRTAVASWLSPQNATESLQSITSMHLTLMKQLEALCVSPSSQSCTEQNSTRSTDISRQQREAELHQLKLQLIKQEIKTEEEETAFHQSLLAPHRVYQPTMTHDGICWVAVATFQDGSKMVGHGDCPFAALVDYDMQWLGAKGQEKQ